MKTQKDLTDLKGFATEYVDFALDFDQEMDFQANKASYDGYSAEMVRLETDLKKKTYFLRASEYKHSTFEALNSEIDTIDRIGMIRDNSDFSTPLCTFDTFQLQAFEYRERLRDFVKL